MDLQQDDPGGSIGPTWPPKYEPDNDRVKGFQTRLVTDPAVLRDSVDRLERLQSEHGASRVSCRFIVRDDVAVPSLPGDVEAAIDLDGEWEGHRLLYYGSVTDDRTPSAEEREVQRNYLDVAQEKETSSRLDDVRGAGFRLSLDPDPSDELVERVRRLYDAVYDDYTFEFSTENVREFFDGRLVLGWDGDRLVSSYVAEMADLRIDRDGDSRAFRMAELSDAATRREYGGNGLFVAGGQLLLEALEQDGVDLAYGETRAGSVGVNVGARRMGRRFAGRLPKHCRIDARSDFEEEGPYENLNVWYMTEDDLDERF